MFRISWVALVLIFVSIALAGCPPSNPDPNSTIVPNLVGLTRAGATSSITAAALALGSVAEMYSNSVAAGIVMRQDPTAGTRVQTDSTVSLTVSLGPEPVPMSTVPNVVGQTQAAATARIASAGLALGTVTQTYSPTVPAGQVISQNPAAGTQVQTGSTVSLTVSRGPAPDPNRIVPNVTGASQVAAEASIVTRDLVVGTITQAYSPTVPAGQVISQNPAGGTQVLAGSAVSFVVSLGPEPVPTTTVPNVAGLTQAAATSSLTTEKLVIGTISEAYNDTVPFGQVISQNPAAGTSVPIGTAVALTISLGPQPILISTIEDLQKIGNDPAFPMNGSYRLTRDLAAGHTATWNSGAGFKPIGTETNRFLGILDGDGHTITGLTINRSTENFIGLFGYLNAGASVHDLNLAAASIVGLDNVGALLGYSLGDVLRCTVSGTVSGDDYVGGQIGQNRGSVISCESRALTMGGDGYLGGIVGKNDGSISNCFVDAAISGNGDYFGGIAGVNLGSVTQCSIMGEISGSRRIGGAIGYNNGQVVRCAASNTVRGYQVVGGLIGEINDGSVAQSFATGNVLPNANWATSNFGGLVGRCDGIISVCYALGDVEGTYRVGGLVGELNYASSIVSQSFAAGSVNDDSGTVGGLVGDIYYSPQVLASFWDMQTSGVTVSAGGTGLNTNQMKTSAPFVNAGWDFSSTWGIDTNNSYPYLLWAVE